MRRHLVTVARLVVAGVVGRLLLTTVSITREVGASQQCEDDLTGPSPPQAVVVVGQATPTQVWEFMGDFSNYKQLNPHLEQWHVLADSTHARRQVGGPNIGHMDTLIVLLQGSVWKYRETHHQYL